MDTTCATLFIRDLPKWSRLVVSGTSINPNQAAEIILRTSDTTFTSNDREWKLQLFTALNILRSDKDTWLPDEDKLEIASKKFGFLDLYYLRNYQIASCWVGGPRGWCSWDGTIGCDGYNIGKYPTIKDVYDEWKLIAQTWNFLKLRCQLWNVEYNQDDSEAEQPKPVVEFIIENGYVTVINPNTCLKYSTKVYSSNILTGGAERGCELDNVKRAAKLAAKSVTASSL